MVGFVSEFGFPVGGDVHIDLEHCFDVGYPDFNWSSKTVMAHILDEQIFITSFVIIGAVAGKATTDFRSTILHDEQEFP